ARPLRPTRATAACSSPRCASATRGACPTGPAPSSGTSSSGWAASGWTAGGCDRGCPGSEAARDGRRLAPHGLAELLVQLGQLVESPGERGDLVGELEDLERQGVALLLVGGEAGADECAREAVGVAERVGDAVRGERILEVAGVADEGPARPVRPAQEPGAAGEGPGRAGAGAAGAEPR